jgi:N-acetyl-gamma-glutamylphosphate reductase
MGKFYNDFNMRTAFHQVTLAEETSQNLSILTPWGNIRPLFMPEGISSASGILNSIMADIFEPESKHTIAQSYRDYYEKNSYVF